MNDTCRIERPRFSSSFYVFASDFLVNIGDMFPIEIVNRSSRSLNIYPSIHV